MLQLSLFYPSASIGPTLNLADSALRRSVLPANIVKNLADLGEPIIWSMPSFPTINSDQVILETDAHPPEILAYFFADEPTLLQAYRFPGISDDVDQAYVLEVGPGATPHPIFDEIVERSGWIVVLDEQLP